MYGAWYNKHVVVFQDMLTEWPMVFPVPDQKTERLEKLLCEEVVLMFGVPEALLSDRGANLLSHLTQDVCSILGIKKLNMTPYHPECDGMMECFNRTLKTMLRKRAAQFGSSGMSIYLHSCGHIEMHRMIQLVSSRLLLFGWDCRSPTEASLLLVSEDVLPSPITERSSFSHCLQPGRQHWTASAKHREGTSFITIGKPTITSIKLESGFSFAYPSDESGRLRKLSWPWHGPYRVTPCNDTNITATKVYFPMDHPIHVHQTRVKPCPVGFTAGYFWYGGKRHGSGCPPRWVEAVLAGEESPQTVPGSEPETESSPTDSNGTLPAAEEAPTHLCLEACHSPNSEVERLRAVLLKMMITTPDLEPLPGRYSLRMSRRPPERYNGAPHSGRALPRRGVV